MQFKTAKKGHQKRKLTFYEKIFYSKSHPLCNGLWGCFPIHLSWQKKVRWDIFLLSAFYIFYKVRYWTAIRFNQRQTCSKLLCQPLSDGNPKGLIYLLHIKNPSFHKEICFTGEFGTDSGKERERFGGGEANAGILWFAECGR